MTTIVTVLGLAMALSVMPVDAKTPKSRTLTGCVDASHNQYELSTVTAKKGKPRHYTLNGSQNFAGEVGHRVKVTGLVENGTVKVATIETIATSCH
jgi:hypothetical protein